MTELRDHARRMREAWDAGGATVVSIESHPRFRREQEPWLSKGASPPVAYRAHAYLRAGWTLEEAAAFLAVDVAALEREIER